LEVIAYILTDPQGQIRDRDMLDLYDGFLSLNIKTKFYKQYDPVQNKDFCTKEDVVLGHVAICLQVMKNLDVPDPSLPYYPTELKEWFGRNIIRTDLRHFEKILEENEGFGKDYFVKPVKNKLFTGTCMNSVHDIPRLGGISKNTKVYVSSYVKFVAEFRVYVYKNKIVDVFRYWGDDWKINVNPDIVDKMVSALTNMPIFYSLDVGVDDKGRTLLIEINDGYALGNYGLAPIDYAKMSMDRWQEIMKESQHENSKTKRDLPTL
jgi:hypothetical protein